MKRYPGERSAYSELLSIVANEVTLEDRWSIVEWVRREMHAATPDEIEALVDRASVEISTRIPPQQRRTMLARLDALRERVREVAWEQASVRGAKPEDLVDAMHEMIRAVDPALSTHLSGVGTLAGSIAKSLGLDVNRIHDVVVAGRLLDVGKIATQGAHSDGHAAAGERMLRAIPALQRYAFWIRAHHERLDGSGYPDRLRAADIPLEVRILSVADVFDTMACANGTQTVHEALAHIDDNAGTLYDATVVGALDHLMGTRRLRVVRSTAA
jgi:HD-GYP domain-containing protein (c-di-GMP phosphodiesterase class II)